MAFYFIYCCLIIVSAIVAGNSNNRKGNPLLRMVPALIYICFVGFRSSSVGVDSESYREMFQTVPSLDYIWIEIGFDRLIRLLYECGLDYNSLYLASIFLTTIPIYLVLEKSPNFAACAILLYIVTVPTVTNGIRQCIAVGWFSYGVLFIQRRKIIPFLICMVICALFHYSSLILAPLFFFLWKPARRKVYVALYLISFVFIFINPLPYIESSLALLKGVGLDYDKGYAVRSLSILGFVFESVINIVTFVLIIRTRAYQTNPSFSNCALFSFCFKNVAFSYSMMGRMALYFNWIVLLLTPDLVRSIRDKGKRQIISLFYIVVYSVGFIHQLLSPEMKLTPFDFNFILFR